MHFIMSPLRRQLAVTLSGCSTYTPTFNNVCGNVHYEKKWHSLQCSTVARYGHAAGLFFTPPAQRGVKNKPAA